MGLFNYSHCGSQHVTIHMEPWGAGSLPRGWWVGLLQYSAIHCYVHLRHWYSWRSRCPGSLSVCLWLRGWGFIVASNTLTRHKKIVDLCICAFSSFSFPGTVFFFFLCFVLTGAAVGDTSSFPICLNPFILFLPFCSACQFYTVITDTTLKILFHYTSSSCRLLVGCVLHGLPVILCHIMQSPKLLLKYTSVNRNKQIQMCQIVVNSFIM